MNTAGVMISTNIATDVRKASEVDRLGFCGWELNLGIARYCRQEEVMRLVVEPTS